MIFAAVFLFVFFYPPSSQNKCDSQHNVFSNGYKDFVTRLSQMTNDGNSASKDILVSIFPHSVALKQWFDSHKGPADRNSQPQSSSIYVQHIMNQVQELFDLLLRALACTQKQHAGTLRAHNVGHCGET